MFKIFLSDRASTQLELLRQTVSDSIRAKAVDKTIGLLANPRHPGLQTHEFTSQFGPQGEKVFEAYAQQNTPAAYRVFWYYGPGRKQITILSIAAHL